MTEKKKTTHIRFFARCACARDEFHLTLFPDTSEMKLICTHCGRTAATVDSFTIHWAKDMKDNEEELEEEPDEDSY